ncbi:MAG: molybdopterin-dependent oxidoreductase [Candidatus Dormibacteria bacterium]
MKVSCEVNGSAMDLEVAPNTSLLKALRSCGLASVKHGCETGECGVCTVLVDGVPRVTCVMLAAQAEGRRVTTVESLGRSTALTAVQQALADNGSVQCGFCIPGMVLVATALLARQPDPSEAEVRDALSGNLCRCTGYLKPVEAILRAAAVLRGELPGPGGPGAFGSMEIESPWAPHLDDPRSVGGGDDRAGGREDRPGEGSQAGAGAAVAVATQARPQERLQVVGKRERKVDAAKLVAGRPCFVDDIELRGLLHAKLLTSPHAHARLRRIDVSAARRLPGVHAVLTHADLPRVVYTTAGQSWPEPGPHDQFSLDSVVRFVGDRVAAVAADTEEIAERALGLIEVDYEILPAVFDPEEALRPGAPQIHPESEAYHIADPKRNLAARIDAEVGDVEGAMAGADLVVEAEYLVPQVQQTPLENHIVITYWDEDERMVVRTSTQVPYHVRRIIAPVIGLPPKRIRVIKPRIGGGFGVKQEVLIEDICAHLTMATNRPVRLEYTRAEEFRSSRSRHPQRIRLRTGVNRDGTIVANDMYVLANTGAYGTHALTVQSNTGSKTLPLYRVPNVRFVADVVYTNLPPAGAFRGYGAPQGFFALESHMDEVARRLGMDPLALRLQNCVREGDQNILAVALGEGKEGLPQTIESCGLAACIERGAAAIGWDRRRQAADTGPVRRGVGMAIAMHGTAIPGLDMGAASIKLNDDGSFNVLVGATDLGTGSDTVLAQIAAEVLGVPLEDIVIHSSDTDFTPFDTGAYASSTTYISGGAVKLAAEQVRAQIFAVAGAMLGTTPDQLRCADRIVSTPAGLGVSVSEVALHSLHVENQHQIMATASNMSQHSPPPFAAQFAEVEVDMGTGAVTVLRLVSAVDCGRAINPASAEGQVEGGATQALGYAISEEMLYDDAGGLLTTDLAEYRIFGAQDMPSLETYLVETHDPFGPYGAKAIAEIPLDGVAPAVANAVADATGVRIREIPLTPPRVWAALQRAAQAPAGEDG